MTTPHAHDAPAAVIERFAQRINASDVDGALALYDEDAVFVPRPGEIVRGRDQIEAALRDFTALRPTLEGRIVKVLEAGDTAVVFNEWTLEGTAPDGTDVAMGGTSADVLRRSDAGEWRVLIDDPWGA